MCQNAPFSFPIGFLGVTESVFWSIASGCITLLVVGVTGEFERGVISFSATSASDRDNLPSGWPS